MKLISIVEAIKQGEPLLKMPSWPREQYIEVSADSRGHISMQPHAPVADSKAGTKHFLVMVSEDDPVWVPCAH